MKLRNLFAVTMASAVLFSCTEKVIVQGPDEEAGTVRVRVGLSVDETQARAGHYDETANVDEMRIFNYALFIFKSTGVLEAALTASPYTSLNTTPGSYPSGGLTFTAADNAVSTVPLENDVLTLSAGTKLFFAIVNAPSDLLVRQTQFVTNNELNRQSLFDEKLTFTDLSKIVGEYNSQNYGNGIVYFDNPTDDPDNHINRGFMMTTISPSGFEEKILLESDEDQVYDIELQVGRAMAKVSLGTELKAEGTQGWDQQQPQGTLDVMSYKIINNPKEMYILPHTESRIWSAPYFYHGAVEFQAANYFDDHYFVSENSIHNPGNYDLEPYYIPVSTDAAKTFTYAIENSNLTPRQGTATQAVIKGKFTPIVTTQSTPAVIYDNPKDKGPGSLPIDGTFYRVWIVEYTGDGINTGMRYDDENAYFTDPIDPDDPDDKDMVAAAVLTNNGWTEADKLTVEIHYFDEGMCYYRLPLYNDNYMDSPYTVKRNSYYMIDIVSVAGAGYPDENGGPGNEIDPTEPLEPQTNIKAKIKVNDWDKVEQPGNL